MLLAGGMPPNVISERLDHATVAFTMDTYTEVAEELDAAAAAATPSGFVFNPGPEHRFA